MSMNNPLTSVCCKATIYITIDNTSKEFQKNIGDVGGELSEDQEDDVRFLVSDILPQSGGFKTHLGEGKFFIEFDEMEVEEIN